jgi:hypothetical protein
MNPEPRTKNQKPITFTTKDNLLNLGLHFSFFILKSVNPLNHVLNLNLDLLI